MTPEPTGAAGPRTTPQPAAAAGPIGEPVFPDAPAAGVLPGTLRLVAVMDRLRSPGGCPWDAAQTHASLARYLLEETYEVLEALDTGDRVLLREELGDLLLQVAFHARIAAEDPTAPFAFDDVAADVADKLVRRHPHVFAEGTPEGDAAAGTSLETGWERRKQAEKGRRATFDGIPDAIPALLLARKMLDRLAASPLDVPLPAPAVLDPAALDPAALDPGERDPAALDPEEGDPAVLDPGERETEERAQRDVDRREPAERAVGATLLGVVVAARHAGVEPEQALRGELRRLRARVADAEAVAPAG